MVVFRSVFCRVEVGVSRSVFCRVPRLQVGVLSRASPSFEVFALGCLSSPQPPGIMTKPAHSPTIISTVLLSRRHDVIHHFPPAHGSQFILEDLALWLLTFFPLLAFGCVSLKRCFTPARLAGRQQVLRNLVSQLRIPGTLTRTWQTRPSCSLS